MTESTQQKEAFSKTLPDGFYLDPADLDGLRSYLRYMGWLGEGERLESADKAGEGNMNLTLRLSTSRRSFILKQSRPWVEKYPQIEAPESRALVEIAFYETAGSRPALRDAMPKLLGSDPDSRVVALEDLGAARDFTGLYAGGRLSLEELDELVSYLVALHPPFDEEWGEAAEANRERFTNRAMRALNHEHIFRLPLAADNGLDLNAFTPGLQAAAEPLKKDTAYIERVTKLGEIYLADGDSLVHGDFFPGSWLRTDEGLRIIDPEFCFLGTLSFDLGFMLGHLYLADQPPSLGEYFLSRYQEMASSLSDSQLALARQFAGVEVMRRLIGVAQLPLTCGLDEKKELLDLSRQLVLAR